MPFAPLHGFAALTARSRRFFALMSVAVLALVAGACRTPVWQQMMPTPLVHQYIGGESFSKVTGEHQFPELEKFFVTNRPGHGPPGSRVYRNGDSGKLSFGIVTVRMGEPGLTWSGLVDLSVTEDRGGIVPLAVEGRREVGSYPGSGEDEFAAQLDEALGRTRYPDITIYVHGAKSNFDKANIQGAQFHHFMGRETAFITFSWPSAGKIIQYRKDVEFAASSAPRLADLVVYLAENTRAEKINILAYSAGALVVAPGLSELRGRFPDESAESLKRRLRIGEVYFAAPDVGFRKFVNEYLPAFTGIVQNTSVTYHAEDHVLKFSQRFHGGESRLGRPDGGELSEGEIEELEALLDRARFDAIDMEYTTTERAINFKMHDYWYLNEWVSSDVIIQFLYDAPPSLRGLDRKPRTRSWFFPPDYPDRLERLVEKGRAKRR